MSNTSTAADYGIEPVKVGALPPGATSHYSAASAHQAANRDQHSELLKMSGGTRRRRRNNTMRKKRVRFSQSMRPRRPRKSNRYTRTPMRPRKSKRYTRTPMRPRKSKRYTRTPRKMRGGAADTVEIPPISRAPYPTDAGSTTTADVHAQLTQHRMTANANAKLDTEVAQ